MNDEFQQEIDDILSNVQDRKKKINSSRKGKQNERNVCKILNDRFNKPFSRSLGSGNRLSQVNLPQHAQLTFGGDICTPEGFLWSIECKSGYEDRIDLHSLITTGNKTFDGFLEQAVLDAEKINKQPLVLYKRNQKKWLSGTLKKHVSEYEIEYGIKYRDWIFFNFDRLLEFPDTFFFNHESSGKQNHCDELSTDQ